MNTKFSIPFYLVISLFCSITAFGQDIKSVRYNVTPNIMLDLIDKYPEEKESIEKRIKSESMKYVDFILIENELIQVYWRHDNSLMGVKIYSKSNIYTLSSENELTIEKAHSEIDSIFFKKTIKTNDSLYQYELSEKNAFPLTILLEDSLTTKFEQKRFINNYPEIMFIVEYGIFPTKLIFGQPKAIMTFDLLQIFQTSVIKSKEEYLELIINIKKKKKRKKILNRIIERE
jgi:hypothetical protein